MKRTEAVQQLLGELEAPEELSLACAVASASPSETNIEKAREMLKQFKANLVGTIEDRTELLDALAVSRRGLLDTKLPDTQSGYQLRLKQEYVELQNFLVDVLVKRYNAAFDINPTPAPLLAGHLVQLFDKVKECEAQITRERSRSDASNDTAQKEYSAVKSSLESYSLKTAQMISHRNEWESNMQETTAHDEYLTREDFLQLLVSAESLINKANSYISRIHQLLDNAMRAKQKIV